MKQKQWLMTEVGSHFFDSKLHDDIYRQKTATKMDTLATSEIKTVGGKKQASQMALTSSLRDPCNIKSLSSLFFMRENLGKKSCVFYLQNAHLKKGVNKCAHIPADYQITRLQT